MPPMFPIIQAKAKSKEEEHKQKVLAEEERFTKIADSIIEFLKTEQITVRDAIIILPGVINRIKNDFNIALEPIVSERNSVTLADFYANKSDRTGS